MPMTGLIIRVASVGFENEYIGAAAKLLESYRFLVWDEPRGLVRWMCSWDTTEEELAAALRPHAEAAQQAAQSMQQAAQGWTAEKNYERDGGDTAPSSQPVPALPAALPMVVPARSDQRPPQ